MTFLTQRIWQMRDEQGEPTAYVIRRFRWWNPLHQWHRLWHEVWANEEFGPC